MSSLDVIEKIRRTIIPKFGLVTQLLEDATGDNYYVQSETHIDQFVGRVPLPEEQFEILLVEMGFRRNPLASLKTLSSTGETEEGSWRKVGYSNYPTMQLHVVLYDGNPLPNADTDCTYVYAHWEKRWDTNPIEHYRGVALNGQEGVSRMKQLLNENGINFEPVRP